MRKQSNGPAHRAHRVLVEADPLGQLEVADDQGAADDVGVAADVLGRGVHDDVGAEGQRLLEVRRGERVVDDEQRARVVGDRGERLDVADVEQRVGRASRPRPAWSRPGRIAARTASTSDTGAGRVREPPRPARPCRRAGTCRRTRRRGAPRGRRAGRAPRTRVSSAASPEANAKPALPLLDAPPARPRGRSGWGWRSGCTRSRRAARRRRPACRSRSRRSAGSPRRSWGPARSPRGSRASRIRTCRHAPGSRPHTYSAGVVRLRRPSGNGAGLRSHRRAAGSERTRRRR